MISARRSRGVIATVDQPPGVGAADVVVSGAGAAAFVEPGTDPGPALASVVYTSAFRLTWSCGRPFGPGPTWIWVTFTARGRVSSLNRNSSMEKKVPAAVI